ncbi:MAG TPA: hypothetical protein VD902_04460 [Symbiobacteriaceae bacterium]|nr:hypothetical protein [Symbiobacteriaceae bacterium]
MQQHAPAGRAVIVGNAGYPVSLAGGQVRVHLPFSVSQERLSEQLIREGFPLAHESGQSDTQGWGHDFQSNGYYPYWVYPDPDHPGGSVFAFNPQPSDVVDHGGRSETVDLSAWSTNLVRRWVPVLEDLNAREGVQR